MQSRVLLKLQTTTFLSKVELRDSKGSPALPFFYAEANDTQGDA